MSGSQYDFRSALSGQPDAPAGGEEEQAGLLTTLTSQENSALPGASAPLSLNLANGLLVMGNPSGSLEVDTTDQRVVIDPDSPSEVGRRDGDVVLGATDEAAPLWTGQAVEGEALQPMVISKLAPVSEGVSASSATIPEGEVTEPQENPVHVVSVQEPDPSDLAEDFSSTEGTPLAEALTSEFTPMTESVPAVETVPGEEADATGDATGPVVTVDSETGETVILAEDLRITVGPENGQVRIEPSDENVPLSEDTAPITVDAGGMTMVIDPENGTLEVTPIEGESTDITVDIGDLSIVMDGETGEISVDPSEGSVSVDPETGLVTIEPPVDKDDTDEHSPGEEAGHDPGRHHSEDEGGGDEGNPEDRDGAHDDGAGQGLPQGEENSGEQPGHHAGDGSGAGTGGVPGGVPSGTGVPGGGYGDQNETEDQDGDTDEPDTATNGEAQDEEPQAEILAPGQNGTDNQNENSDSAGASAEEPQADIPTPDQNETEDQDGDEDEDEDKDEDEDGSEDTSGGDGDSDSEPGGKSGNAEDGTGINAAELNAFQTKYLEPLYTTLQEQIPKFAVYSSSDGDNSNLESVRLGKGPDLPIATRLANEINTSMTKMHEILTGMRQEVNRIDRRIKANIHEFDNLEEDQVFSAQDIASLLTGNGAGSSSPGGYDNYGSPNGENKTD